MEISAESLKDIQTIQSLLHEYEQALKKSNSNVETLKERIGELLLEQKELKSKLSHQQNKHTEAISALNIRMNKLAKENAQLLLELSLKEDDEKENNKINESPSKSETYRLKKENDSLKQKIKETKEDLKNELNEKISLLTKFDESNNNQKDEIAELKEQYKELNQLYEQTEEKLKYTLAEMNMWKKVVIDVSKHRLKECDYYPIEIITKFNKEEAEEAPIDMQNAMNKIVKDITNLYDDEIKELSNDFLLEKGLRRKAHHRYMNIRGNLRTLCRIRPLIKNELNGTSKRFLKETFTPFDDTITVKSDKKLTKYEFDYIFTQRSSQQDIYDEVSMLVKNLIRENNICIIAYGQTNSGKTYTIEGPPDMTNPGIVPRAIKDLFAIVSEYPEIKMQISLSIIEIYNDIIYSLLDESIPTIEIFEGNNNEINMPNLKPIPINSIEDANNLFKLAKKYRVSRQNLYNEHSSRSHCIYTFYVNFIHDGVNKKAKLHFIDLAGSERLSKNYGIIDEVLKKESQMINLSLNSLANVLNAIALKKTHIPFRDCKLTHFLKESLRKSFNILLMLHLSPISNDLNESFSTLDFGSRFCKLCRYKTGEEKTKDHRVKTLSIGKKNKRSVSLHRTGVLRSMTPVQTHG